jgi:hypothetical protein
MPRSFLPVLALSSLLSVLLSTHAAGFADAVVSYRSGQGFATEFGTGLGFTNAPAVLGEPSKITPGQFGGPVDPFNPPYLRDQMLSIGAGGSVTVQFNQPILNDPSHPFGLDFIIFGNAGFSITNGNFSGGGITDGSLFGASSGTNRVYVSRDNTNFFLLNPSRTPSVDGLFPIDGSGNFNQPVNPGLTGASFAGRDLAGIRGLYAGAGGGAGFDLSWAQDANGLSVSLDSIRFVRVEVLSGALEIDAFAAVAVPAPPVVLNEDFTGDPLARGWKITGDPSLFRWNATNQNLEVTWDSARRNSYFYRPLNTILGKSDDFAVSFDLRLETIAIGLRPGKLFTFELAIGLLDLQTASSTNFVRGTGTQSPNLVEFDYFPDSGFGATISPTIISTNNQFASGFSFPFELTTNALFKVVLNYTGSSRTMVTTMTRNGQSFGPIKEVVLPAAFTDFRVDTLAISSYSDAGADGSILAKGVVDNLRAELPHPPIRDLQGGVVNRAWQIQFLGQTNWVYTLERTDDFRQWAPVSPKTPGTGSRQSMQDAAALTGKSFYRVRAERP